MPDVYNAILAATQPTAMAQPGTPNRRSSAAEEGIAWLKTGVVVLKHNKKGAPQETVFRLDPSERSLTWTRSGFAKLRRKSDQRAVNISDILEVLVGRESEVFKRHEDAAASGKASKVEAGQLHLSFSLLLTPALPPLPDDAAPDAGRAAKAPAANERQTLDLSTPPFPRPHTHAHGTHGTAQNAHCSITLLVPASLLTRWRGVVQAAPTRRSSGCG